ncbi:MAG: septal ring lytic transglycosylase RlpA family protein [Candidatus Binatus sp.]
MDYQRTVHFFESKRLRWTLAFSALFTFMLAGCSSQNFTPMPISAGSYYAPSHEHYRGSHSEVASWYGPGFAGHPTSTGEIYKPEGLTAASRTLPLGSHVRVENPDTGRSVVVRINDRGPFVRGRSLDLSHGAARQIGLTGKGFGRVQVTPTATGTPSTGWSSATYADRPAAEPRHLHYVSYESRTSYSERRPIHHHYHRYRYYHHYSSARIVANPIGDWLARALPRF